MNHVETSPGFIITLFFSAFFSIAGFAALIHSRKKPTLPEGYAFRDCRPMTILQVRDLAGTEVLGPASALGLTSAISDQCLRFILTHSLPKGFLITLKIEVPGSPITLNATVVQCRERLGQLFDDPKDTRVYEIDVRYGVVSHDTGIALTHYLFQDATPRSMERFTIVEADSTHLKVRTEQRKQPRKKAFLPIMIETDDHGKDIAMIADLSHGGSTIRIAKPLPIGCEVIITMPWASHTFTAKVSRCDLNKAGLNPTYEVGLASLTEMPQLKDRLKNIIDLAEAV